MPTNSQNPKRTHKAPAPFFIGYLPMPRALLKFYLPLALLLIAASGFIGYSIAALQKPTGPATWNTAQTITIQGYLTALPYPVLHRMDFTSANPRPVESILLVNQGKHASTFPPEFTATFAQQMVAVEGYEIRRGGWRMLEVTSANLIARENASTARALSANAQQALKDWLAIQPLGEISLQGEIVDSKCYLGVMKPGAGKIHKACAEVCLLGGIPPMLVAKDAAQQKYGYLLIHADGSNAARDLAHLAAEKVQITGQLQRHGDLLLIAMHTRDGIKRK